ncbi:MAG: hypothetical protein JKY22_10370 [Flavobacteriaceae bacterium]|nr:hypothetical protein [Flavobacteriaceae bacterium]
MSAEFPKPKDYPTTITNLGEAIKRKRIDLRLPKTELARAFGVNPNTIWQREDRGKKPNTSLMKKIIEWLGYVPPLGIDESTLGGQLVIYRAKHGYTQEDVSGMLRINNREVSKIESGEDVEPVYLEKVRELLNQPTFI